jgi:hypothetical protein
VAGWLAGWLDGWIGGWLDGRMEWLNEQVYGVGNEETGEYVSIYVVRTLDTVITLNSVNAVCR